MMYAAVRISTSTRWSDTTEGPTFVRNARVNGPITVSKALFDIGYAPFST